MVIRLRADDGRHVVAILQFDTVASEQQPTTEMKLLMTQEFPISQYKESAVKKGAPRVSHCALATVTRSPPPAPTTTIARESQSPRECVGNFIFFFSFLR